MNLRRFYCWTISGRLTSFFHPRIKLFIRPLTTWGNILEWILKNKIKWNKKCFQNNNNKNTKSIKMLLLIRRKTKKWKLKIDLLKTFKSFLWPIETNKIIKWKKTQFWYFAYILVFILQLLTNNQCGMWVKDDIKRKMKQKYISLYYREW